MTRFIRYPIFPAKNPKTYCSNVSSAATIHLQKRSLYTHQLFDEIPYRDLRSLNSQLASYARSRNFLAAWTLFWHMHCAGLKLSAYTFTPALGACSSLPGPERGKQVHGLMIKTGADTGIVSKTALMDMYFKYGLLSESVKVFEEMEFKDVVTWNALLSNFLREGLVKEAFGVFEAMRREGVEFSEFTLCTVLKACASLKAFEQGKQVHGLVVVLGRDLVVLGTALIDFYSVFGCISDAMKVFYSLDSKVDDVMKNSLISGCVQNRKYEEAFSVMSTMRPNVVALTTALAACSENSDLWIGKQIHCLAVRFGFTCDTQLCNVLLDMYAKCGKISNAGTLFDRICQKDVVSWTSMIDAYGSHGHGLEALELFKKMGAEGRGVSPNSVTFLVVLSACAHSGLVEQGRKCFNLMRQKYGLDPGPEHYVCLIDTLGRAGQIEEVWCLFNDMLKNGTKITPAVWAALVNACSHCVDVTRGEFAAKHLLELEPDNPANYVLLSNFYATIGNWDASEHLRSIMRKKGLPKEVGSSWVS
ncbi:pentatricopeptide repeat-containing protein At5g66500, mitochondrial [Mangifera indica]|uniref:pentatricopeptide repeat-containing protein At5g66500, mitochondrial n=1 Tax=Mangifera indica TaxID=29780 RepID=UPI001CFC4506|nr:pentatricopeptide repeat-containing protein At5g66500, mitochondrial [Mangifera indica]